MRAHTIRNDLKAVLGTSFCTTSFCERNTVLLKQKKVCILYDEWLDVLRYKLNRHENGYTEISFWDQEVFEVLFGDERVHEVIRWYMKF